MGEGGACGCAARGDEEASEGAKNQARKEKGRRCKDDGQTKTQDDEKTLGHLALGLGGVFRIDLADHAVPAVTLGGIKAAVGALDQRVGVIARFEH